MIELPLLETLPKLKFLKLKVCTLVMDLTERPNGFPILEMVDSISMSYLQHMVGSFNTLHFLRIKDFPMLRRLGIEMKSLGNLTVLMGGHDWWEQTIWDDNGITRALLEKIFRVF